MKTRILLLIAPLALILPACGPSDPPPSTTAKPATEPAPTTSPSTPAPPPSAPAHDSNGSPAEVTEIYFDAMEKGDWAAISNIFHPESLKEFRNAVDFLEKAEQNPGAIQARAAFFGPGTTAQTVGALTDKDFFGRVMTALMGRPQNLATIVASNLEVIGTVPDGDDRAHVLIRSTPKTAAGTNEIIETVTYKKDGEAWRVTLTARMKSNLLQLRNKIGSTPGSAQGAPRPAPTTP